MIALGIDYGEKNVGLAIAEDGIAVAAGTLKRTSDEALCEQLRDLAQQRGVERIVVGLPIGLSGKGTAQTEIVENFCEKLRSTTTIPVVVQDERLTTVQGGSDSGAAVVILQTYLDRTKE